MTPSMWLPQGKHWGLHISHFDRHPTTSMVGGGSKLIWHTTEGTFSSAHDKFATGADIPHLLINPDNGMVYQYLALNQFAKCLEHPPGTPETNRANCAQIEIAGKASQSANWPDHFYEHLGALAVLVEHRRNMPRRARHPFGPAGTVKRLTAPGFIRAAGHLGHCHAPNQRLGHWDPGKFNARLLFAKMKEAEVVYL